MVLLLKIEAAAPESWTVIDRAEVPSGRRLHNLTWVFKHKRCGKAKARLCVQGCTMLPQIDYVYDQVFAATARSSSNRTICALAAVFGCELRASTGPLHIYRATSRKERSSTAECRRGSSSWTSPARREFAASGNLCTVLHSQAAVSSARSSHGSAPAARPSPDSRSGGSRTRTDASWSLARRAVAHRAYCTFHSVPQSHGNT